MQRGVWLGMGVVVLAVSGCVSRYHAPAVVSPVELPRPHSVVLATGEAVPCGAGMALAVHDRLVSCTIDRPATIQFNDFPAETTLWFRWDGSLEEARYVEGDEQRVVSFDESGDVVSEDPGGGP